MDGHGSFRSAHKWLIGGSMKNGCGLMAGLLLALMVLFSPNGARAAVVEQWASSVIDFSSQYGDGYGWFAANAIGAPDTFNYGDIGSAWAALNPNESTEYLTLGYSVPVYATGALVRETYNNGFVYRIDAVDTSDVFHNVWTGTDTSSSGVPYDLTVIWAATDYLVKGLKIYVNGLHTGDYEEIDAVKLFGAPVPLPASLALLAPGLFGIAALRKKFGKQR